MPDMAQPEISQPLAQSITDMRDKQLLRKYKVVHKVNALIAVKLVSPPNVELQGSQLFPSGR